jgi:hypothetical protein
MTQIRFRMVPPGTVARVAERDAADVPSRPRIQGGDAARLHEEIEVKSPSPRIPSATSFSLRAQGGRITRFAAAPPMERTATTAVDKDPETTRAAQTADQGDVSPPLPEDRSRLFQTLVERVQALFRRP